MKINKKSDWFVLLVVIACGLLGLGTVQAVQAYKASHVCKDLAQQRQGHCKVSSKDCLNTSQAYVLCSELHP